MSAPADEWGALSRGLVKIGTSELLPKCGGSTWRYVQQNCPTQRGALIIDMQMQGLPLQATLLDP